MSSASQNVPAQPNLTDAFAGRRKLRIRVWATVVVVVILASSWLFARVTMRVLAMTVARSFMRQGLTWPTPREVDGLPVVTDAQPLDQALLYLQKATRLQPEYSQAYQEMAHIYMAEGAWSSAAQALAAARRADPRNPLVAWDSVLVYEQLGHGDDQSTPTMQALWSAANQDVGWLIKRGDQARTGQQLDRAALWYQRAVRLNPQNTAAWRAQGQLLAQTQQWDRALVTYQQATTLFPQNRDLWYGLGLVQRARQAWPEALAAYRQAVQAKEGEIGVSAVYLQIGLLYQNNLTPPNPEGAAEAYTDALRLDGYAKHPELRAETHFQQGRLLTGQSRWAEALTLYQQVLAENPKHYWAHTLAATSLVQLGKSPEAEMMLRQAIELNQTLPDAYRSLGNLYQSEGRRDDARSMYVRVLVLAPQDAVANAALRALR